MAAALLGASMVVQGGLSYLSAKENFKQQQENNAQARKAGDRQQALTSVNINRAHESFLADKINISTARMQSRSEAIVSAAAAGTAGMSVNDSLLDLERSAGKAETASADQLHDSIFSFEESRDTIEANVRSRTILGGKPSAALAGFSTALGFAEKTYGKTWDGKTLSNWWDNLGKPTD